MKPHKVSKELIGAVAEEQKHQAIDAAKKKAVAQHADYDTFKKMVSVAHLKPLHAPGGQGSKGCSLPAWKLDPGRLTAHSCSAAVDAASTAPSIDFAVQQQQQQGAQHSTQQQQHAHLIPAGSAPAAAAAVGTSAHVLPRTSQEFAREWRRHCHTPADKYRLLKQCGPEGLAHMFRVEVDGLLLGHILQAMQQQWKQQAALQPQKQQLQEGTHMAVNLQQEQQQSRPTDNCLRSQPTAAATEEAAVAAEAVLVLRMLRSLTGAGRFDLSVRLLDKASKAAAADLCSQLQALLQQQDLQQQQQQSMPSNSNTIGGNDDTTVSSSIGPTSSGQVSTSGDSSGRDRQLSAGGNSSAVAGEASPPVSISGQVGVGGDSSGGAGAASPPRGDTVSCGSVSAAEALADLQAVMAKLRL